MKRIFIVLLIIAGFGLVGGCLTSLNPGPGASIMFSGSFNTSDGEFVMNGRIVETTGENRVYENVRILLYTSETELERRVSVGDLDSHIDVHIEAKDLPKYVILHSPDFWTDDSTGVEYYELGQDGMYISYDVGSKSKLPVELPDSEE